MRVFSFLLFVILVASCGREKDNSPPTIQHFSINGEENMATVSAGANAEVFMQFKDDVELNQYRLVFNENFAKANGYVVFSATYVNNLAGKDHSTTLNVTIPDSAVAGPYSAELNAIDQRGNESTTEAIQLTITNPTEQPTITITAPDLSQPYSISKGDTLRMEGIITDNMDLELVCIDLDGTSNLYTETFDLTDTVQTNWNFDQLDILNKWIIIPTNAASGDHQLVTRAQDNDEHITVHQATITVVD